MRSAGDSVGRDESDAASAHVETGDLARRWVRGGYLLMLAVVLLSPLDVHLEGEFLTERLELFFSPSVLTTGDMVDAVRNVLLLAGWGLVEVLTDSGRSGTRRIRAALLGGAAIGLSAEVAQLALPDRIPSLLDAAMNAAGAGLGALVTHLSVRTVSRGNAAWTDLGVPASALAAPYALAVLVETTFPVFRPVAEELMSGGPLERAAWAFRSFSVESITVIAPTELLLFLPGGFLLAAAFLELERPGGAGARRTALLRAVAAGLGIAVVGELARAPLGVPVQLGPFLVHAAALSIGAWAGIHVVSGWLSDRAGGMSPRQFLFGYVLLLALWRLRPFVPHPDPAAIAGELSLSHWSPLYLLSARGDLYSAADVVRTFLLFLPLGAVVGAGRPGGARRSVPAGRRALAWIVVLAVLLELGQALIAGRVFDGTDLVVMAVGGGVGWAVVRRAAAGSPE